MFAKILWVAMGGAAGSVLRFLVQRAVNTAAFPLGTIIVNTAGCFLIGIVWGYSFRSFLSENSRLLLATGFCGGFTTFSAFTQESLQLVQDKRWPVFALYTGLSVLLGILATFAGYKLSLKIP